MEIKVEFSEAAVWGNVDPVEDGWNETESIDTFAISLVNHINDEYPKANVEVVKGINDRITVDGMTDHDEVPWIENIVDKVWNGDSWMVAA